MVTMLLEQISSLRRVTWKTGRTSARSGRSRKYAAEQIRIKTVKGPQQHAAHLAHLPVDKVLESGVTFKKTF